MRDTNKITSEAYGKRLARDHISGLFTWDKRCASRLLRACCKTGFSRTVSEVAREQRWYSRGSK